MSRGLYVAADASPDEHHSLAQVQARVPHGVICLLSALAYHGLSTALPHEVWMAIGVKDRKPRPGYPALRIVRFSARALEVGVIERAIDGAPIRITTPARTVVDCFIYRNKIGIDVAVEALRDYQQLRAGTLDELWQAASQRRVGAVMRPYIEAQQ